MELDYEHQISLGGSVKKCKIVRFCHDSFFSLNELRKPVPQKIRLSILLKLNLVRPVEVGMTTLFSRPF